MKIKSQVISESLIYEQVNGKPLFYNGYKKVLSGKKSLESIMGSSFIQAILIARILSWLNANFSDKYMVLTNEVGIQIDKKNWRLADIAMLNNEKISQINNKEKYLEIAPDYIIEIDTKASTEEGGQFIGFDYFQQKTDALLDFGVKKLIWIFTHNQKIMVAEKGKTWFINNWSELPLEIEGKSIFLSDLTKDL
jgi:hypothetical protein